MSFFSNAIRIAREKRKWTQTELASQLSVTQGTISFWENGVEAPSLNHQVRLIELMPDIMTALTIQELNILDRLQAIERAVFSGKCACAGCGCSIDTPITTISDAIQHGKALEEDNVHDQSDG